MLKKSVHSIAYLRTTLFALIFLSGLISLIQILASQSMGELSSAAMELSFSHLVRPLLYTALFFTVQLLLTILFKSASGGFEARVGEELKSRYAKAVMGTTIDALHKTSKGDLLSRFQSECAEIAKFLAKSLPDMAFQTLRIVLFLLYMSTLDLFLTGAYLLCVALVVLIQATIVSPLQKHVFQAKVAQGALNSVVQETLAQRRIIAIYGAQERVLRRVNHRQKDLLKTEVRAQAVALPLNIFSVIMGLTPILILCFLGARQVAAGAVSLSAMMSMFFLAQTMLPDLLHYTRLFGEISKGMASMKRYLEIVELPMEADRWTAQAKPKSQTETHSEVLAFSDIQFAYSANQDILNGISFSVGKGQMVALVGESGCGKSTLLRIAAGLEVPTGGYAALDGTPLPGMTLSQLRERLAFVSQDSYLFSDTVAENVRLWRRDGDLQSILNAVQIDFDPSLSVGEGGVALSGGQSQRVSLARGLFRKPDILLIDEGTSALDCETESYILEALRQGLSDTAILMTAHRRSAAEQADVVVFMEDGRIVAAAEHGELLKSCQQYRAFWRREAC